MSTLKSFLAPAARRVLHALNLDFVRSSKGVYVTSADEWQFAAFRRRAIFMKLGTRVLYDVGAQIGGWSQYLRNRGYMGAVVAFEPNPATFRILEANSRNDSNWVNYNLAVGDVAGTARFNIAGNLGESSSLLAPHVSRICVEKTVEVEVCTLAPYFEKHGVDGSFIKLDVQGFEERVLLGVGEALTHVSGVYLEAALEPDYQNSCMFDDLHAFMQRKNFALVHTEPGYVDPATGYMREINCMYVNKKLHSIHS